MGTNAGCNPNVGQSTLKGQRLPTNAADLCVAEHRVSVVTSLLRKEPLPNHAAVSRRQFFFSYSEDLTIPPCSAISHVKSASNVGIAMS